MFKESRESIFQFLCLPARNIGSSYPRAVPVIHEVRGGMQNFAVAMDDFVCQLHLPHVAGLMGREVIVTVGYLDLPISLRSADMCTSEQSECSDTGNRTDSKTAAPVAIPVAVRKKILSDADGIPR